jgi:hypothetical protein
VGNNGKKQVQEKRTCFLLGAQILQGRIMVTEISNSFETGERATCIFFSNKRQIPWVLTQFFSAPVGGRYPFPNPRTHLVKIDQIEENTPLVIDSFPQEGYFNGIAQEIPDTIVGMEFLATLTGQEDLHQAIFQVDGIVIAEIFPGQQFFSIWDPDGSTFFSYFHRPLGKAYETGFLLATAAFTFPQAAGCNCLLDPFQIQISLGTGYRDKGRVTIGTLNLLSRPGSRRDIDFIHTGRTKSSSHRKSLHLCKVTV